MNDAEMNPPAVALPFTVSVIVPARDGGAKLNLCLAAVARLEPAPLEVIVVADGDVNGCVQTARAWGMTAIGTNSRVGPAAARNMGARAAKGDVLFFIDADVLVPADALRQIEAEFQAHPTVAGLIGSYDLEPTEENFLSRYKNLLHHYVHQQGRNDAFTFWGACGAIRRNVFLEVGGFDESYTRPAIEDIELGARLHTQKHAIRLLKSLQVRHMKRWTVESLLKTDFCGRAIPWAALLRQRGSDMPNDLNVSLASRASVVCAYLLILSVVAGLRWHGAWGIAAAMAIALGALNAQLYAFFRRQWGLTFAVGAVAWHWLYYLYSGLAYALVLFGLASDRCCGRSGRSGGGSGGFNGLSTALAA